MPSLPNLLESRRGRLSSFFFLYMSEGLPQGFTAMAVALEFKRMGMSGAAIGAFAAIIMLPWTWKWMLGPFVDNFHLKQFGRRKQWIVTSQIGMLLTLVFALLMFPSVSVGADGTKVFTGLGLFSAMLLAHNIFAASQDVAIDALACTRLDEKERGLANGLMFGGAEMGAAIGGSGVLFLKGVCGFGLASLIVPLLLLGVLSMVVLMIFENSGSQSEERDKDSHVSSNDAMKRTLAYIVDVLRIFFTTRQGFLGVVLAVIPCGGMALSLTVSTVLTPTIGMTDDEIATMGLVSSLIFIVCCMTGGFVSDRFGRRMTLTFFSLGTLLPTIWMGWRLHAEGWVYPAGASPTGEWPRREALIVSWWVASMVYAVFNGLMYGIRTAFFMDVVERRIAATHFTACMALTNLTTVYCYWWQGKAITSIADGGWGFTYLNIFLLDAALGAFFVFLLPFVKSTSAPVLEEKES
jgi:MFS transporter, PAT family, beta-lactamase induction signal transducer AmpG